VEPLFIEERKAALISSSLDADALMSYIMALKRGYGSSAGSRISGGR